MTVKEIYEDDLDNPTLPTFLGWIIENGDNIFAIGNISDEEISKIVGKKTMNIIKSKDYDLENWNVSKNSPF